MTFAIIFFFATFSIFCQNDDESAHLIKCNFLVISSKASSIHAHSEKVKKRSRVRIEYQNSPVHARLNHFRGVVDTSKYGF